MRAKVIKQKTVRISKISAKNEIKVFQIPHYAYTLPLYASSDRNPPFNRLKKKNYEKTNIPKRDY